MSGANRPENLTNGRAKARYKEKGVWGCLLDEELLESMMVWVLTALPLVCGIFICFRCVVPGKSSRCKSYF